MNYATHLAEDRRLVILKLLAQTPQYSINEYVLRTALGTFGHAVSQDRLRADLAWLAEQELLKVETIATLQVATLSQRGLDVAEGRATVPGVKRPIPGE